MKLIKRLIGNISLLVTTTLLVCNVNAEAQSVELEKSFVVKNYKVSISFPKKWKVETKNNNPFDLQCTNGSAFASVFVFYKVDLKKGQTPMNIFHIQNDDIIRKRSEVEIINEEKTEKLDTKKIHSLLFSAEKDGSKNYYYCNLVEFDEGSDRFVWILFTSLPSYALANLETMKKIVASTVLIQ